MQLECLVYIEASHWDIMGMELRIGIPYGGQKCCTLRSLVRKAEFMTRRKRMMLQSCYRRRNVYLSVPYADLR